MTTGAGDTSLRPGLQRVAAALREHSCSQFPSTRSLEHLIDEVGGSAVGFSIISAYCQLKPERVSIPPWSFFTRRDIVGGALGSWLTNAAAKGCAGLMVKASGTTESFSPSSARGANSSKSNHVVNPTAASVARLPNAARALDTSDRGVIGQHLVPALDSAVYFHTYTYGQSTVALELLGSRNFRTLVVFSADTLAVTHHEIIGDDTQWFDPDPCAHLAEVCRDIAGFAAETTGLSHGKWNIEGMWAIGSPHVVAFQIRPSPLDRPLDRFVSDARQPFGRLLDTADAWHEVWRTRFVWGAFTVEVDSFTLHDHANLCLVPERAGAMDELVEARGGDQDVVYISGSRGFRLTHERELLPSVRWRQKYRFCYVPDQTLVALRGRRVRFDSDGDRCVVSVAVDSAR